MHHEVRLVESRLPDSAVPHVHFQYLELLSGPHLPGPVGPAAQDTEAASAPGNPGSEAMDETRSDVPCSTGHEHVPIRPRQLSPAHGAAPRRRQRTDTREVRPRRAITQTERESRPSPSARTRRSKELARSELRKRALPTKSIASDW